jgi:uncharacterized delta-60 repeat protein
MIPTLLIRRAAVVLLQAGLLQLLFLPPAVAAAGDLDTTFGGDGRVTTGFAESAVAEGLAVQADGKIVAAGGVTQGFETGKLAVARYKLSGALDDTFGGDGRVTTQFAGVARAFGGGVAIQVDSRIVVAGTLFARSGTEKFAVARYDSDGTLDDTFGGDGRVTTGFADGAFANGVAIQADGKIVATGSVISSTPTVFSKFALARYLAA